MLTRCHNPNSPSYVYYGAKNITVCEEWRSSYAKFKEWAESNGYQEHLTIDRKRNEDSYSPINCRWKTAQEQALNKGKYRNNKSGYRGVRYQEGIWVAQIGHLGINYHIGRFKTKEEAAEAYNKKALELFGPEAKLNTIIYPSTEEQ